MSELPAEARTRPFWGVGASKRPKAPRLFLGVRARVILLIIGVQALMLIWVADSELEIGVHLLCYSLMIPTA
ncbi:MAG: hypothetical protein ACP5R5_05835, partial [Armatimonadota bacterium]